ncbi:hypothetical protein ABZ281_28060 [Streptomyces sp. NPDC006265]|uniref:hypothetical protein n=1 Tax=Streptomyces sp. NPDC006265 TaxID=3156740 RepID=UPI00339FD243
MSDYIASDGIYTGSKSAEKGMRLFPAVREYGKRHMATELTESDLHNVDPMDGAFEVMTDFLVDFLHLAHSAGVDVDHLFSQAMGHFEPERDAVRIDV